MHRIDHSTANATLPAPDVAGAAGYFKKGDPQTGVAATVVTADFANAVQEELGYVITQAGLALSKTDNTQLRAAILKMVQDANSAVITGATFEASVANGEAVRWDAGNNRFDEAIADGTANNQAVGFADVTNSSVYCYGETPALFAGLTPGARYYLGGTTAGAITTTAPADKIPVGIAKSATTLFVDIDQVSVDAVAGKNKLINPSGEIYQRKVAATADDAYFADRWNMLTQSGTVTPSVLSAPEDGYPAGVRVTQSQATAQRFGFSQIIEGKNCKDLRGQSGVMAPRIRVSNSQAIRYAILGWTGAEDSVASDVVNDWTSAAYTAGNFFLAANLSVIAVGEQTPAANTWTSLAPLSAALGSAFNNIVVMVWTEGVAAQNITLDWDYVQFESGARATAFERRNFADEIALCQRYYEKSTDLGIDHDAAESWCGHTSGATNFRWAVPFRTRKRAAATITIYNVSDPGSTTTIRNYTAVSNEVFSGVSGYEGHYFLFPGAATSGHFYVWSWTASAEL